jgi:hypothetical protein
MLRQGYLSDETVLSMCPDQNSIPFNKLQLAAISANRKIVRPQKASYMFQNLPLSAKQKESLIEDFVLRSQKTKPLVIPAQKYSTVSTQNVAPLVTQTANTPNPSLDAMQSQMQQIIPLSQIKSQRRASLETRHTQLVSDEESVAQGTEAGELDNASEAGTAEGETAEERAAAAAALEEVAAEAAAAEALTQVSRETLKGRITGFGSSALHREVRGLLPSTNRGHSGLVNDPVPSVVQETFIRSPFRTSPSQILPHTRQQREEFNNSGEMP